MQNSFQPIPCVAGPTLAVKLKCFYDVRPDYPHVYKQEAEGKGSKGDVECDEEEEGKEHLLRIK